MKKIIFIQPALPKYRIPFFNELEKIIDYEILIFASEIDFLQVKSEEYRSTVFVGDFIKIGPCYWQSALHIPKLGPSDILVISGNPRIINYMFLFLYFKLKRVNVIWWGQGWTAGSRGFFAKLRRKIMLLADGIAVYTEKEAKGIKHNNIVGLNNGLDISDYPTIKKDKVIFDCINLLFIGRLTDKSNLILLLKSLILVNINYHLDIIGDGPIKKDLIDFVTKNNLQKNITWHGNVFDNNEIQLIAKKSDLFVYPGAVGLSLIHAFSLSLPALIHNKIECHMPEIAAYEKNYNGFEFEFDNIISLSNTINNIDPKLLYEMSLNARETVEKSFNTKDMAIRFREIIQGLNEKNIN